jgi:sulfide dehydrogenase cytochrome subunit
MNLLKFCLVAMAFAIVVFAAQGPARAEMASGAVLTNTCFSCHGTDGKSVGDMPTIAGKSKDFITGKLIGFKTGTAESTVMGRIAKGFSDDEIAALAKFFSSQ